MSFEMRLTFLLKYVILPQIVARAFTYFSPATRDSNLLIEDHMLFILCDASDKFSWQLMMHEALYSMFKFVAVHFTPVTK